MKILVTGFDPFGGEPINPAIESVKKLPDNIAGAQIIKLEIPTVKGKSIKKIEKAIEEHNPDVILSIGQAGGRFDISVERVGINLDDFRIPDNEGNQTIDEPIFPDGENAYFVDLPVKAMVKNIQKNKIPASVSYTAGTFICNHILYGTLYLINKKYKNKKSGFIHIPFLPEQVINKKNTPSMELNTIVKGLIAAIEAIVKNDKDIKEKLLNVTEAYVEKDKLSNAQHQPIELLNKTYSIIKEVDSDAVQRMNEELKTKFFSVLTRIEEKVKNLKDENAV